jgi:RNA polymerase sigma-70 factor (ECF subfamily)
MTLPRAYEEQLVERAKTSADAFGELYDHYFSQIYRFVYSRLRNQEAAEDVTSEVFFKALRAIGRYRSTGPPFSAWLYQISTNAITDHHRSKKPTSELEAAFDLAVDEPGLDEQIAQKQEAARIWAVIDTLPEQQRMALTLKLGEDLKLAQIGVIMGKSEGAVKLLVHRAMQSMRKKLDLPQATESNHG